MRRELARNLFVRTRSEALSKENHLTEFLAAALRSCKGFRDGYAAVVLGAYCRSRGFAHDIVDVETQIDYSNYGTPDMRLTLSGGQLILCEHKLMAEETTSLAIGVGLIAEPLPPRRQLRKYLDTPNIAGLVFVAEDWRDVDEDVLTDAKYIRPERANHFLWRDVFPALVDAGPDNELVGWLREGFELFGYTPALGGIGQLEGNNEDVRRSRANFAKLWRRTRSDAYALGWRKISPGSQVELYLEGNADSRCSGIWISPSLRGRFRMRFTPREGQLETVADRLTAFAHSWATPLVADIIAAERKSGRIRVPELSSSLRLLLSDPDDAVRSEGDLAAVVSAAIRAVDL